MTSESEWRIFDERWWLLPLAVRALSVCALIVVFSLSGLQVEWLAAALAILIVLRTAMTWWIRVRLTRAGVEVRRLRTKTYRWEDLESAATTAGWNGAIVLRGRVDVPGPWTATLPFPRGAFRRSDDRTLPEAAAEIEGQIERARLRLRSS